MAPRVVPAAKDPTLSSVVLTREAKLTSLEPSTPPATTRSPLPRGLLDSEEVHGPTSLGIGPSSSPYSFLSEPLSVPVAPRAHGVSNRRGKPALDAKSRRDIACSMSTSGFSPDP